MIYTFLIYEPFGSGIYRAKNEVVCNIIHYKDIFWILKELWNLLKCFGYLKRKIYIQKKLEL